MPRTARKKSESGFYHIMLRGIAQQYIFEDDEDRAHFIETLKRYKAETGFEIYAYCLMGNHAHLLLKDAGNQLETIMKKLAGSYAYYFNWKYQRAGHLFQDRFKSEVIEDDGYFLSVMRYIHKNPQKAGIANVSEYKWSSHKEYTGNAGFVNTSFGLELLGGRDVYISFINQDDETAHLEITDERRITDEAAVDIINRTADISNPQQLQQLMKEDRDKKLAALKRQGLSVRQISRLTGISRGVVYNA